MSKDNKAKYKWLKVIYGILDEIKEKLDNHEKRLQELEKK